MALSPLDFLLLQLGSPGYYQIFLAFLLCCLQLPITFTRILFDFYLWEPPHRCIIPNESTRLARLSSSDGRGFTISKNEWYPLLRSPASPSRGRVEEMLLLQSNTSSSTSSLLFDQCSMYADPVHHWKGTRPCPAGWEYWTPNEEANLVTEFNLVCDAKMYASALVISTSIAAFLGALAFGWLADTWGRSKTLHLGLYLFVASSLSAYFAFDFLQFVFFYILQVIFVTGVHISSFVLLMELLPTPYQMQASVAFSIFSILTSSLSYSLLSLLPSWRYLQLCIAVPSFAFFLYVLVIPSSPLWSTVVKGNLREASRTLTQFGKLNGKSFSESQLCTHLHNLYTSALTIVCGTPSSSLHSSPQTSLQPHEHQQIENGPRLSRPGPILRWYLLTHFYLFFVVSILNSQFLSSHSLILHRIDNINNLYNSFLDLGVTILAYHLALWLGAKAIESIIFVLIGLLILASIVLREYVKTKLNAEFQDKSWDHRIVLGPPLLALLARSLSASAQAFVWLHAVKTLPTNVRAKGLALCFFWTQVAGLSVPHLIVLGDYLPEHVLLTLFALLSLLASTLSLLFPSLSHTPLPNTLDDLQGHSQPACRSSLASFSTLNRYPSYRNFDKTSTSRKRKMSTCNVYTLSPHPSARAQFDTLKSFHQAKLVSTNDTSDSSLSSSYEQRARSRSGLPLTYHGQEDGFFPSTSYMAPNTQEVVVDTHTPRPGSSYIHFGGTAINEPLGELNNQFTVVENAGTFVESGHYHNDLLEQTLINNFHRPVSGANKLKIIQV